MEPILRRPFAGRDEGPITDDEHAGEAAAGQVDRPANIGGTQLHRQRAFLHPARPPHATKLQPFVGPNPQARSHEGDRDQERFEAGHGEGFSGLLKTWSEDRGGHFALDAGVAAGWIAVPTSSQTRS